MSDNEDKTAGKPGVNKSYALDITTRAQLELEKDRKEKLIEIDWRWSQVAEILALEKERGVEPDPSKSHLENAAIRSETLLERVGTQRQATNVRFQKTRHEMREIGTTAAQQFNQAANKETVSNDNHPPQTGAIKNTTSAKRRNLKITFKNSAGRKNQSRGRSR